MGNIGRVHAGEEPSRCQLGRGPLPPRLATCTCPTGDGVGALPEGRRAHLLSTSLCHQSSVPLLGSTLRQKQAEALFSVEKALLTVQLPSCPVFTSGGGTLPPAPSLTALCRPSLQQDANTCYAVDTGLPTTSFSKCPAHFLSLWNATPSSVLALGSLQVPGSAQSAGSSSFQPPAVPLHSTY